MELLIALEKLATQYEYENKLSLADWFKMGMETK
jgi:hypothetical protein